MDITKLDVAFATSFCYEFVYKTLKMHIKVL